jgi:hypothetical protein
MRIDDKLNITHINFSDLDKSLIKYGTLSDKCNEIYNKYNKIFSKDSKIDIETINAYISELKKINRLYINDYIKALELNKEYLESNQVDIKNILSFQLKSIQNKVYNYHKKIIKNYVEFLFIKKNQYQDKINDFSEKRRIIYNFNNQSEMMDFFMKEWIDRIEPALKQDEKNDIKIEMKNMINNKFKEFTKQYKLDIVKSCIEYLFKI